MSAYSIGAKHTETLRTQATTRVSFPKPTARSSRRFWLGALSLCRDHPQILEVPGADARDPNIGPVQLLADRDVHGHKSCTGPMLGSLASAPGASRIWE